MAASGGALGRIDMSEPSSNLAWGGPTWRTLYVTACTSIYHIETNVAGDRASFIP